MKKSNNLIHVRLDSSEAMQAKKDVLQTEADLIKIAQSIRRYRILRLKELQLKINLSKKVKDFKTDLRKLRTLLPKVQIPKILKRHEEEMHTKEILKKELPKKQKSVKKAKVEKKSQEDDLEKQLKEIQGKLSKLG